MQKKHWYQANQEDIGDFVDDVCEDFLKRFDTACGREQRDTGPSDDAQWINHFFPLEFVENSVAFELWTNHISMFIEDELIARGV